uniref:Uncharacterized protein n=1 Tax=Oryza brachyantha TaxID=4533 RepID=J3MIJ3_ORYBR
MAESEFARGVPGAPTVRPVWAREILSARRPPPSVVSRHHLEYEPVLDAGKDKVPTSAYPLLRCRLPGRPPPARTRSRPPPTLCSAAVSPEDRRRLADIAPMHRAAGCVVGYGLPVGFDLPDRGRGRGKAIPATANGDG